jgi:hypothetical protein
VTGDRPRRRSSERSLTSRTPWRSAGPPRRLRPEGDDLWLPTGQTHRAHASGPRVADERTRRGIPTAKAARSARPERDVGAVRGEASEGNKAHGRIGCAAAGHGVGAPRTRRWSKALKATAPATETLHSPRGGRASRRRSPRESGNRPWSGAEEVLPRARHSSSSPDLRIRTSPRGHLETGGEREAGRDVARPWLEGVTRPRSRPRRREAAPGSHVVGTPVSPAGAHHEASRRPGLRSPCVALVAASPREGVTTPVVRGWMPPRTA